MVGKSRDSEIRRMISRHAALEEIMEYAKEDQNMYTLKENGCRLVALGISTPEEWMKIAYE